MQRPTFRLSNPALLESPSDTTTTMSILDTDLYKLTMQQAILEHFPTVNVRYNFTNRDSTRFFSRGCIERLKKRVNAMASLALSPEERQFLKEKCPYFKPGYLDYLSGYNFQPEQVTIEFQPDRAVSVDDREMGWLIMHADGSWLETILWEVPLMFALSESYFECDDMDWNYDGQEEQAYRKGKKLLQSGIVFSEFGSRRRRSLKTHDLVMKGLVRASQEIETGALTGTSNVHLAHRYNVKPIGTIAHEWFMGVAAYQGYEGGTARALSLWQQTYGTDLSICLTDTFSSKIFFKDFTKEQAMHWQGLRQDSGDPFAFAPRAKEVYENLGIDYHQKTIVYSDGLSVEKCLSLHDHCVSVGFKPSFGIGTNFTNDFSTASSHGVKSSKALNIVIKLASIDGKPCVKISDELTKNTGASDAVKDVKKRLGIEE